MFAKILILFFFVLLLSSCCRLSFPGKLESCECKEFEKELKSLIVYDSKNNCVYFNEHLKIEIPQTDKEPRRIYPLISPSIIFRNKNCFIGENKSSVKKMFQIDQLLESKGYAIIPSIEHYNCLKHEMNCKELKFIDEHPFLNIKFSTEGIVKETIISITDKKYELEFR